MKSISCLALATLLSIGLLHAAPPTPVNPDFTKGEAIPKDAKHDWTLGATGARGWIYSNKLTTVEARQIAITKVAAGSPAASVLQVGDVLLGVGGKAFSYDPREEFGKALTAAEAKDGKLSLTRWRGGATEQVTVQLPVLGSYSATAPYDCPKSKAILDASAQALAKRIAEPGYNQNAITRSLNALGLLATGDPQYHPLLKKEAEWAASYSVGGMATWYYGYVTIFLSEYIMATGDSSVLPGLRRIAMEASKGQSNVGSWGHRFAMPDGRLFGYGMMNAPGAPLTTGLVLAREAGVKDPEVTTAIERSNRLLRFYIGKGAIPYGDHAPFMPGHEDNGKCGMVTVLFDQLGDQEGTEFFAKMSTAAHSSERDCGHTGNFFNMTWAMPGVARGGPQATGAWMEEFGAWYFDLARSWDGYFMHQGAPSEKGDAYNGWDATGAYLIAYAMPRKAIRLTGKKASCARPMDAATARQVVRDGRGFTANGYTADKAYDQLSPELLLQQLASWSPVVRERAAKALGKHKEMPVEPLIQMLDAPNLHAQQGACTALAQFKDRAAPAVPKLRELLKAKDLWLRVKAAEALAAIGKPAMEAVPDLLKIIARGPTPEDPRAMEQRYVIAALFSSRDGMLGRSLEGVDRNLLFAAVRSGLRNEDGRTRGCFTSLYANLPYAEMTPLLPDVHKAIIENSPSGEMFDGQIQTAGLEMLSKNRVDEGIELIADYVRLQKRHGSENHIVKILGLLEPYGAHAQRAIPLLEKAANYFEKEETDFPKDGSLKKAALTREAIAKIRAATAKPELVKLAL